MTDLKTLTRAWNDFWFRPESPVPVAIFRILFGLLVLQFGWFMSGELHSMFGQKAIVSQAANDAYNVTSRINLIAWLVHNDSQLNLFWMVFIAAAICLTFGFCTRLSAIVVYLVLISCEARNNFIFTGADNLMRCESFLLIFTQCGAALSIDRLLNIWRSKSPAPGAAKPSNPWGLRLLQLQIALCYWAAYSSKICGNMWIDGSAVYYVTHIVEENKYAIPYVYDHLWTCRLLSWGTLVLEFALAVLIWFKELRLPLILLGIFFHMMLDYTLIIPQFQTIMIISLISFIESPTFQKMAAWIRNKAARRIGAPLSVAYDGTYDLSCRLAETVRRLDVLHLIELIDVHSAANVPPLLAPVAGKPGLYQATSGNLISGYESFTKIAWRLPLFILLCPLLYLPGSRLAVSGISWLLSRAYPKVAYPQVAI